MISFEFHVDKRFKRIAYVASLRTQKDLRLHALKHKLMASSTLLCFDALVCKSLYFDGHEISLTPRRWLCVLYGSKMSWSELPSYRCQVFHLRGFLVLESLRCLCSILMPLQFELNEFTPLITHSNSSVGIFLDEDFTNTFILVRRGIFTDGMRPNLPGMNFPARAITLSSVSAEPASTASSTSSTAPVPAEPTTTSATNNNTKHPAPGSKADHSRFGSILSFGRPTPIISVCFQGPTGGWRNSSTSRSTYRKMKLFGPDMKAGTSVYLAFLIRAAPSHIQSAISLLWFWNSVPTSQDLQSFGQELS